MENISFEILDYSLEGNGIVVRPFSTEFKNPSASYSPMNINFTNLNPDLDLNLQIASIVQPVIQSIINYESDTSQFQPLVSSLSVNTIQSVPISDIVELLIPSPMTNSSIPLTAVQEQVDSVVTYKLNETYNNMLSATLLDGIEFLV
jgi:hypothetical protein